MMTPEHQVQIVDRPDHDVTVALVAQLFLHDHSRSDELLAATALPAQWRAWAGETSRRIPRRQHELTTAPVPP